MKFNKMHSSCLLSTPYTTGIYNDIIKTWICGGDGCVSVQFGLLWFYLATLYITIKTCFAYIGKYWLCLRIKWKRGTKHYLRYTWWKLSLGYIVYHNELSSSEHMSIISNHHEECVILVCNFEICKHECKIFNGNLIHFTSLVW